MRMLGVECGVWVWGAEVDVQTLRIRPLSFPPRETLVPGLCVSVCLPPPLSLALPLPLSLSLSPSLSLTPSRSFCLLFPPSIPLHVFFSLSGGDTRTRTLTVSLYPQSPLHLQLCVSLTLSLPPSIAPSLSQSLSPLSSLQDFLSR